MISFLLFLILQTPSANAETRDWRLELQTRITTLTKSFSGELGLQVRNLEDNSKYSFNSDTPWYLASSIKLFVLIKVLEFEELGKLSLDEELVLQESDYRDGAGETNWKKPGDKIKVNWLVDQMMAESDNTATDLLIRRVGLEEVNKFIQNRTQDIGLVTPLLDVRYRIYSELHPKAIELTNMDFLNLKKKKTDKDKLQYFLTRLKLTPKDLKVKSLSEAFKVYYNTQVNTGTLEAYADILQDLTRGKIVSENVSKKAIEILKSCRTGKQRIKSKFSNKWIFAHKTGTQNKAICDMGIIFQQDVPTTIVTICAKEFKNIKEAEKLFSDVGDTLHQLLSRSLGPAQ